MTKLEKQKTSTLKRQFVTRLLIVLLIILCISSTIQYIYLNHMIKSEVSVESLKVSKSIEQGINETQAASEAIEIQMDLKLKLIAQNISIRLGNKPLDEITNEDMKDLSKEFNIAGLTLFKEEKSGDIVGVKSTEPSDIGFSFKKYLGANSQGFKMMSDLLHGTKLDAKYATFTAYTDKNTVVLPIAPSGSHLGKPIFYKYGYYVPNGKDYIINPYFEANEVYHFTQQVGPNTWIKTMLNSNKNVDEIAVLTPQVYANPSLVKVKGELWKKVVYGKFNTETKKDRDTLVSLAKNPKEISYIEKQGDKTYYKMFIPTKDGKFIYVGLDYNRLSAPLKNMALIFLVFSLISLIALFILSTRFFGNIYKKIQVIISQIKTFESGDFSTQSKIEGKDELAALSNSTNHMAETLSTVLKDTTRQAEKVQNLAYTLKADTDDSVEKIFSLSVDLTSKAREDNLEITEFLDMLERKSSLVGTQEFKKDLEDRIESIRKLSDNRTESTTEITLTLSDLIKSLQDQSVELSDISNTLFDNMYKFKLK